MRRSFKRGFTYLVSLAAAVLAVPVRSARVSAVLILLLLFSPLESIFAHQISTAYLELERSHKVTAGTMQWAIYDLERALGIDLDRDGKVTWGELKKQSSQLHQYLRRHLTLSTEERACPLAIDPKLLVEHHFNEAYAVLNFTANCKVERLLEVNYSALFEVSKKHKLLMTYVNQLSGYEQSRVISARKTAISIDIASSARLQTFKEYLDLGVIHILLGVDHILFLLLLLLTSVLRRKEGRWHPVQDLRGVWLHTLLIVSAFTLAHATTFTLTMLDLVALPALWVELAVAATLVLTACNNIYPLIPKVAYLCFGFGLIHGFAIAGVLIELGVPQQARTLAILAFNLGVEVGQISMVVLVIPILSALRFKPWYAEYARPILSLVFAGLGLIWVLAGVF